MAYYLGGISDALRRRSASVSADPNAGKCLKRCDLKTAITDNQFPKKMPKSSKENECNDGTERVLRFGHHPLTVDKSKVIKGKMKDASKWKKKSNKFQASKHSQAFPNEHDFQDRESRTIFVGNLPVGTIGKDLKTLFKSFGLIESIRLRSAVPSKAGMSKKAAVISRQLHADKDSISAYVVMANANNAKQALAVNGTLLQDHHIQVDHARRHDYNYKMSVFVGNLPFKCKDEELYRFFASRTQVELVRVVRDRLTGICKGFGFVVFKSIDGVELALQMDQKEFGGRMIRVQRVKRAKSAKQATISKMKTVGTFMGGQSDSNAKKNFKGLHHGKDNKRNYVLAKYRNCEKKINIGAVKKSQNSICNEAHYCH